MQILLPGLAVALLCVTALPADEVDADRQLQEDISKVAGMVDEDESGPVADYLSAGPSGVKRGEFLTAALARNAINKAFKKFAAGQPATLSLARCLRRHVEDKKYPDDTRLYGFAALARLAPRDAKVQEMALAVAQPIAQDKTDPVQYLAEKFVKASTGGEAKATK